MRSLSLFILSFLLKGSMLFAQSQDAIWLSKINNPPSKFLDNTSIGFSLSATPITFATPVALWGIGKIKKDKVMQNNGLEMAGSLLLANITTFALKRIVKRDRPFIQDPNLIIKKRNASGFSFPSGHTTTAFATATSLVIAYPKWQVGVPAYLWAMGVGYSRMRLGVHYPTDVLVGALIGIGSGLLSHKINVWIHK